MDSGYFTSYKTKLYQIIKTKTKKKKKILINQNAFNPILRVKLLNHYEIIVVSEIDMRYDNINTTIK